MSAECRHKLFNQFVTPHLTKIKALTVRYTDKYIDWEDNYIRVLQQLYTYIHTYNSKQSIDTWLHIVTKRTCFHQNQMQAARMSNQSDISKCSQDAIHQHGTANIVEAGFGTLIDNISDELYNAMLQIDPCRLSAFLLYAQGNNIHDITQIEYTSGHLAQKNEAIIRSRIYWAKTQLKFILKKNGITKSSYTSENRDQPDYPFFDEQEL